MKYEYQSLWYFTQNGSKEMDTDMNGLTAEGWAPHLMTAMAPTPDSAECVLVVYRREVIKKEGA